MKLKGIKKIVILILLFSVFLSALPSNLSFAALGDGDVRRVYLHSGDKNPTIENYVKTSSTVYMGEQANVYLAVDTPNKSVDNVDYALTGYAVSIYFNPKFFTYSETNPIDYKIPQNAGSTEGDEIGEPSYWVSENSVVKINDELCCASALVFLFGMKFPDGQENTWYDLCALPLQPKITGSTEVYISINSVGFSANDINMPPPYDLTLFSQISTGNNQNLPVFDFQEENSGRHTINIVDKLNPYAPSAYPHEGSYALSEIEDGIILSTASEKCDIHYFKTVGDFVSEEFSGPSPITITDITTDTKITCWAKYQTGNRNESNRVTFTYIIIPERPYLFDENGRLYDNIYTSATPFTAFVKDGDEWNDGQLSNSCEIYYTFSESVSAENPIIIPDNDKPDFGWVKIEKGQDNKYSLPINQSCNLRLITKKSDATGEHFSRLSEYKIKIQPEVVNAVPGVEGGIKELIEPTDIELTCETPGATILYTKDGTNPITNGIIYTAPITVYDNTTIKAVALSGGTYSDITIYHYAFENQNDFAIDAFKPSGMYENSVDVTLFAQNPDYKIKYKINDGDFIDYDNAPITIKNNSVITAYATDNEGNMLGDRTYSFNYTIIPKAPEIHPLSTQFNNSVIASLFLPYEQTDEIIYYTTDGTNPIDSNTRIAVDGNFAEIEITENIIISAVTEKNGVYSEVETKSYEILHTKPSKPNVTLAPGVYSKQDSNDSFSTQFAKVVDTTKIYYTISNDGTVPEDPEITNGNLYSVGYDIPIGNNTIIKAVAVDAYGNKSDVSVFEYRILEPEISINVNAPYADKPSGQYDEALVNGSLLKVSLANQDADAEIWYRENYGQAKKYEGSISLVEDTVLQTWAVKNGEKSIMATYVYTFKPLPPVIKPISGIYSEAQMVEITLDERTPNDRNYYIYFRTIGDKDTYDSYVRGNKILVSDMAVVDAYIVDADDYSRQSEHTTEHYFIDTGTVTGSVYIKNDSPYKNKWRLSSDEVVLLPYSKGIELDTSNKSAQIYYKYTYTLKDGTKITVDETVYNNTPIIPSSEMRELVIEARLKKDGAVVSGSNEIFTFEFVELGVPKTTITGTEQPKNTPYGFAEDIYTADENVILYYTLNGNNPKTDSENRKEYIFGETELKIIGLTNIKAVYFSACGKQECSSCSNSDKANCPYGVYGKIGDYTYTIPSSSGGGGGGGSTTIDKTRKYTKDIFGNEHPTHIGYINGYPDGSVQPEGDITREEITSILYRITNHQYEKPFVATGDAFPDVELGRWSAHDIEYMADKEIVYGYPDGEFKPSRNLSRAEFAALIFRFTGIEKANIKNPFTDLEETHWAYNEILALTNSGLIEGYPDKTYKPENNITRAEVMTVINKLLGRKPLESYVKSLEFNPYNDLYEDKWYYVTVLEATITHNYWLDNKGYEYKWEDWK